jgi:hypothetical protein
MMYRFYFVYYGIIVSINLSILTLATLQTSKITCVRYPFTYHWYVISLVDVCQSLLILVCSFRIIELAR